MALIKCSECKKEISDKSQCCIHCGCPIDKVFFCSECGKKIDKDDTICKSCGCPVEKPKENKKITNIFPKVWLALCIIICLLISEINFFNILGLETSSLIINGLCVNVMGVLALLLGISYLILLLTFSKKNFYLLLGINLVIFIYNVLSFQMVTNLFYIICVILNTLITFFVIRKKLISSKFSIKGYIPIFIILIITAGIPILFSLLDGEGYNSYRSNERNTTIPQIEIVTEYVNIRDGKNINSSIIGEVYYGEIYTIISEDEKSSYNWYEIETSNGIRGYIAGKNRDVDYVKELEVSKIESIEEEIEQEETNEPKKEETTTKVKTTKKKNSNKNNITTESNVTTQKVCDESAKQQLTNEYQSTLQQRESEYQANMAKAEQQVNFAKESLDLTGGYLSRDEYNSLYSQAVSSTEKEMLKARYNMSVTYDKMVNTYNAIPTQYNKWKDSYNAWYQDELNKLGC